MVTLSSIGSCKSPGPDGFSIRFFKACWDFVGDEFVAAIHNFFAKSRMLKDVNSTFITLIAKKDNPSVVDDYRPISKRSLRQGFHLSPYLFVLVMEIFSTYLLPQVQIRKFGLHPRCKIT